MNVLTLAELLRMTRSELNALLTKTANSLNKLPEGSPERQFAMANLHKIRWALARGDFAP